jgi:hypothetical protein
LKTTGVVEHNFVVKTAEFRGLNWKVRFTVLTVTKLCERGARSTMLGVPEISGTHGLLSLMTVRPLSGQPACVLTQFLSERDHIFGPNLDVRPGSGGGKLPSPRGEWSPKSF